MARHYGRSARFLLGPATVLALLGPGSGALAQVTLDGTANPSFEGPLAGPDYQIRAELGRRAGRNLFHSFERFGLRAGESATFSGPDAIRNVISRVTGGARSDIDGTIASTIPGADFYFLNPAGVMFGPNARLDLQGSFHVSTADELRFADGELFSARLGGASSFTVAPPAAFGFLGAGPGRIAVDESILQVPSGEALSIVGGDIDIAGGPEGFIAAEAGQITLAAIGGPGEARLDSGDVDAVRAADIRLVDQAFVDARGNGVGTIRIRGGEVVIERSSISADSFGDRNSRGITISGDEVRLDRGFIGSSPFAQGNAGPIVITAGRLELDNGSFITSSTFGTAEGGDIALSVGSARIVGGSSIITNTLGTGRAGNMTVTATEEVIVAGSATTSSILSVGTFFGSFGRGGRLTISSPRVEVQEGGVIDAGGLGAADAGAIDLEVRELLVSGGGAVRASIIFGRSGAAGSVNIDAEEAVLVTGRGFAPSEITATTFFPGVRPGGSRSPLPGSKSATERRWLPRLLAPALVGPSLYRRTASR